MHSNINFELGMDDRLTNRSSSKGPLIQKNKFPKVFGDQVANQKIVNINLVLKEN